MEEKLDKTIESLCKWVDEQLSDVNCLGEPKLLPETISALAELVKARAEIIRE